MTKTPEFRTWQAMISRCHILSAGNYPRYGAVGIKVCDRWRSSFLNFYADMGTHPGEGYSLDRIDGNGNYEPGNCRWATASEQVRNRKSTKLTPESVKQIRALKASGSRVVDLAAMHNVTIEAIYSVLSGRTWAAL